MDMRQQVMELIAEGKITFDGEFIQSDYFNDDELMVMMETVLVEDAMELPIDINDPSPMEFENEIGSDIPDIVWEYEDHRCWVLEHVNRIKRRQLDALHLYRSLKLTKDDILANINRCKDVWNKMSVPQKRKYYRRYNSTKNTLWDRFHEVKAKTNEAWENYAKIKASGDLGRAWGYYHKIKAMLLPEINKYWPALSKLSKMEFSRFNCIGCGSDSVDKEWTEGSSDILSNRIEDEYDMQEQHWGNNRLWLKDNSRREAIKQVRKQNLKDDDFLSLVKKLDI